MSKSKSQKAREAAERAAATANRDPALGDAPAAIEGDQLIEGGADDEDEDSEEGDEVYAEGRSIVDAPILGEVNEAGDPSAPSASNADAAPPALLDETFQKVTDETPLPITERASPAPELRMAELPPTLHAAAPGFTGDDLFDQVEAAEAEPAPPPAAPAIGTILRCDGFCPGISTDEPCAVTGKVVKVVENGPQIAVVLEIDALGIKWPVDTRFIRGNRWEHDTSPSAYPKPGTVPQFDARFRNSTSMAQASTLATAPALKAFKAPRAARRGHVWGRCVGESVAAPGFTVADADAKKREWVKGDIGEVPLLAIDPEHFVKVA